MSRSAQIKVDFYEPVTTDEGEIDKKTGVIIRGGKQDEVHYAAGQIVDGEKAELFVGKGLAEWWIDPSPAATSEE